MSAFQQLKILYLRFKRKERPADGQGAPAMTLLQQIRRKTGLQMRERVVTAVCRTADGVEWTSWKIKQDGVEPTARNAITIEPPSGDSEEEAAAPAALPENAAEKLPGDITIALRTSELLMRIMDLPSADTNEIADMVGFQIDKVSPFPQDQLAIANEVLQENEEASRVLMVAARRRSIDKLGETFESKGLRIHSIDARILGWLRLLVDAGHVSGGDCEIFIIDDRIDCSLAVITSGVPVVIRMLDTQEVNENTVDALAREIGYTLTTLETEHDLPVPSAVQYWSFGEPGAGMIDRLSEECGLQVIHHPLNELPPLSEGILRRTAYDKRRAELVPPEWIEKEERRLLLRKFTKIAAAITMVWLVVMIAFFSVYKVRDMQLKRIEKRLADIEPDARQALENRRKLKALQVYTDRTDSALECLREVTRLLPAEDIKFGSYNYKKGGGVTLRGTADRDDSVYDFFEALTESELFERLKDQSVNAKVVRGVRNTVFSATLALPAKEEDS